MSEKQYRYDSEFWGDTAVSKKAPRKGRKKQQEQRRSRTLLWAAVLIVLFAAFMYGGYVISNSWLDTGSFSSDAEPGQNLVGSGDGDRVIKVLLMGVDSRKQEAGRSDTIMVAFINLDSKKVNLLSIPRDTYAKVPGQGNTKINHAHAYGGADLMKTSVEELLGVAIDRYVEVDFQGFINIVDLLDGVEVDVQQKMYYAPENIDVKQGLQTLNGDDALGYVRYRSDGKGDIGRVQRQQKFLGLMLDQALQVKTLWKLPELVGELRSNVDSDLSVKDMLTLARDLNDITSANLNAATLPGYPDYIDELSYWVPDYTALDTLLKDFQGNNSESN